MKRYQKDYSIDGWPITDNGRPMDKDAVIARLNELQAACDAIDWKPKAVVPSDDLLDERGHGVFRAYRPGIALEFARQGYVTYDKYFGWNDPAFTYWAVLLPGPGPHQDPQTGDQQP
ncbi:hypothetical protein [Marinobacterium jannaschii]|uniref:hypothetical protein n=1 Tax=Marinobacterium jannaschii TaxID=64970 RepID=UPI0004814465|nr:hypothetical protein [Marinobacterium jannaschii]